MSTIEPVQPREPGLAQRAGAEVIGTFILVFLGCGSAVALTAAVPGASAPLQYTGIALAFGLGIAGAIYATGHISGGHLNPAVSVALTAVGRFDARDLPAYAGAQVVGAVLAALALKGVFPDAEALPLTGTSANPARTFGPDLVAGHWDHVWIFLVGPVVGALVGALAYQAVRADAG